MFSGSAVLLIGLIAILLATAGGSRAAAPHRSYRLRTGAKCRHGYVRQVRHVKQHRRGKTVRVREVWCVHKPPTPTSVSLSAAFNTTYNYPYYTYYDVSAGIYYDIDHELKGPQLTYTITDATTGHAVGSFVGTSNLAATCTVVASVNAQDTVQTLAGQAVPPYSGCALSSVSLPAADEAVLTASYAGSSTYARSVSAQEAF
jgi:hypothetical protein